MVPPDILVRANKKSPGFVATEFNLYNSGLRFLYVNVAFKALFLSIDHSPQPLWHWPLAGMTIEMHKEV